MERLQERFQAKETPSPSPVSPNSASSSCSNATNNGGAPAAPAAAPPTSTPISRSVDGCPYPTTFVQADTSSFKHVVQMLTGSADTAAKQGAAKPPSAAKATGPKKQAFKLYERRSGLKNLKTINPLIPSFVSSNLHSPVGGGAYGFSPRNQPPMLSPRILDFPSLALSPVTPLSLDPFNRSPPPDSAANASVTMASEGRAISEKGFYLHPSPRGSEPPRLLPLFPETSPRLSSAPKAGASTKNMDS